MKQMSTLEQNALARGVADEYGVVCVLFSPVNGLCVSLPESHNSDRMALLALLWTGLDGAITAAIREIALMDGMDAAVVRAAFDAFVAKHRVDPDAMAVTRFDPKKETKDG